MTALRTAAGLLLCLHTSRHVCCSACPSSTSRLTTSTSTVSAANSPSTHPARLTGHLYTAQDGLQDGAGATPWPDMVCLPFHMSPELRPADSESAHHGLNDLTLPSAPVPYNLGRADSMAYSEASSMPDASLRTGAAVCACWCCLLACIPTCTAECAHDWEGHRSMPSLLHLLLRCGRSVLQACSSVLQRTLQQHV